MTPTTRLPRHGSARAGWPWAAHIAHRGGGALAPENTLSAIRTGMRQGYRMLEYDVKLSRDGVPFLLHDDTVDRTSNGQGAAAALSWNALCELDFGQWLDIRWAGEPPVSLHAVAACTLAQGVDSNIEIKPSPGQDAVTGTRVAEVAARLWRTAPRPPLLSSFSEEALGAAARQAPQLPRALLIEGPLPADWHARVRALGCMGVHLDVGHVDQALIQDVLAHGCALAVWTVNHPDTAQALLDQGCHAIFTDALTHIAPVA